MAFSMFLRTPACVGRMFGQQVMRIATQPALSSGIVQSSVPVRSLLIRDAKATSTPILNAMRTIQTSNVNMAAAGDHSKIWVLERAVSASLVAIVPLALLMPCKILDSLLAISVVAHAFWGLEAIAVDYVRAILFGSLIPKIAIALVYLYSIATLGGLFYIISHDIGIANSIRRLWAIKAN